MGYPGSIFIVNITSLLTSIAPQQHQVYPQQAPQSTPSYNYTSAINQFSQQSQLQQQKQQQQRPQQQFDAAYYNLYDDDEFYREDDYAQYQNQQQNNNRGKQREQPSVQQQQQQQKQQINNFVPQQNTIYNTAQQDYNEQYLQGVEEDSRYNEQPTKSSVVNASRSLNSDSAQSNTSSPPPSRVSLSFEQVQPVPSAQRSNRFTIPETRPVLKPFSFNYEQPESTNERNVFRNFESSLPVVQLFQQDRPLRQEIQNEKQYLVKLEKSERNKLENESDKNGYRNDQRDPKRIASPSRGGSANEAYILAYNKNQAANNDFRIVVDEKSTTVRSIPYESRNAEKDRFESRNPEKDRFESRNVEKERFESRNIENERFVNENRNYVPEVRNPDVRTQRPRNFAISEDTFYQPSKSDYVTKVPQISQDFIQRNLNETLKQRLNSALITSSVKAPLDVDSKQESSTARISSSLGFEVKPDERLVNRGPPRPAAAYLVESDKKGEYYLYSSESPKSFTPRNPFELSTEEVVLLRQQTNKPEENNNFRQSLPSTNVYTRLTTPATEAKTITYLNKQSSVPSINTFTRQPSPSIDNTYLRQSANVYGKSTTTQLYTKPTTDVKPWKFNVASKQITTEDINRPQSVSTRLTTLSNTKSTYPSTVPAKPSTTPYTPYNYIKQITTLNNELKPSTTFRQQVRSTTSAPISSRDYKDIQTRANQVKVTADRARVLEQNLQRNNLRNPDVNKFVEPTTMRGVPLDSNRFRLSKPAEPIKDNFVDSVSYSNGTAPDSDEYYYDDFEEEYEEEPIKEASPSPSPTPYPTPTPTRPSTTIRVKPEPPTRSQPSRTDGGEKCIGSECNEKPLVLRTRLPATLSTPYPNQTTTTTPTSVPSRGRVRGSATYTTAPSNEGDRVEKPTTSGRNRPTLKPSQSIVSKVQQEYVDIYKNPPSRPEPVYPTPTPDKTAAKCRKDVCLLPDCYCGGKDIPADLTLEETPQIVLMTFDDSVNDLNKGLYADLFEKGRTNPNGCPISATFYVSHEWTDYSQVQNLYANGHEMASHTISHSFGEQFSQKKWTREISGQREILSAYGGVKLEDVRGMRAPFLAVGGNKMFKMLYDANFTYDSSMPVYENRPPSWPYTLDYKIFHDCMIPPCPTRSYPGVWEVPMVMWQDLNGGRCSMGDACSNPPDADGVYKMLMKNFERHFLTNRAPFGLYYHAAWFTTPHHKEGYIQFIDTIVNMPEVWLVSNWQALQWVRDPTPINRVNSFQPFGCDYPDRPKKCNNPKVCNLWHKSGVRYMKTCQPCPDVYPWTGLTGIKNSRVDTENIIES